LAGPRVHGDHFAHAMPSSLRACLLLSALALCACDRVPDFDAQDGDSLAKVNKRKLAIGQRIPNDAEANVVGVADAPVRRGSAGFEQLVDCEDCPFVFKNEERNASDRMMTPRLRRGLVRLSKLVSQTWPKVELRVTEAWDDRREHGPGSAHYEGRAADITTSDQDPAKLGQLAALAVRAGLDWVYYENATHVHVSVKR
jgi:Hedgehog amino-terminal signalling domain